MHIERTVTGFEWVGKTFRIPMIANNDDEAQNAIRELCESDFFRDRVALDGLLGCARLPVLNLQEPQAIPATKLLCRLCSCGTRFLSASEGSCPGCQSCYL